MKVHLRNMRPPNLSRLQSSLFHIGSPRTSTRLFDEVTDDTVQVLLGIGQQDDIIGQSRMAEGVRHIGIGGSAWSRMPVNREPPDHDPNPYACHLLITGPKLGRSRPPHRRHTAPCLKWMGSSRTLPHQHILHEVPTTRRNKGKAWRQASFCPEGVQSVLVRWAVAPARSFLEGRRRGRQRVNA